MSKVILEENARLRVALAYALPALEERVWRAAHPEVVVASERARERLERAKADLLRAREALGITDTEDR